MTNLNNLYDHEIIKLEDVVLQLQKKQGKAADLESFRRECIERMAEAGFVVNVLVYEDPADPGQFAFELEILDRCEPHHEFDYDRQVHEVTHDLLDLGEGGIITTDGEIKEAPKSVGT